MSSPSFTLPAAAASLLASSEQLSTTVRELCEGSCLRSWKIGFAAILLAEGLLFAHIVYFVKKATGGVGAKFNAAIRIGNALAAGIFLSTGLLHIFPEAVELISGEEHAHGRMLGAGIRLLSKLVRDEEGEEHDDEEGEEGHEGEFPWAFLIAGIAFYVLFAVEKILIPKLFPSVSLHGEHVKDVELQSDEGDEASSPTLGGFGSGLFWQGLIQVVGLSLHSLFESMALGISNSFDVALNIFIATVTHRWATAAALSFKLIRGLRYLPFLVLVTLFSSAIPVGVAIGAALSSLSAAVQGVLFAISAGTFLYIGAFELMAEEFVERSDWQLRKFLFTILGAVIITVITVALKVTGVHG
ncbi:Zinc/iron permease [Gracilaria domingensis]|nr:Zinc/iron permease [Gracilaria domingensis]